MYVLRYAHKSIHTYVLIDWRAITSFCGAFDHQQIYNDSFDSFIICTLRKALKKVARTNASAECAKL